MASDYEEIRSDNIKRYGTDIGRIGPMLLADRYDERTHFIFELLQNAEDALRRLRQPGNSRSVSFHLQQDALRVSHFGDAFTEADVRGICGIDESTKEINEIGRFGIGFKSVYAFTDRPQVHSGAEDFAIEEFVRPMAVRAIQRAADETVILIPFKHSLDAAYDEISNALLHIGASALLFLRHIGEISWRTELGASGQYLRESEDIDSNARRVTILGEQNGKDATDEEWLIFSRPVTATDGVEARPIEIAFSCLEDPVSRDRHIHPVERSPLVVFFPTAVETHLGFLVQGPYRTTPSRDNIPRDDAWNRSLVEQTAVLLRTSLCWLRDQHLLNTDVLRCLPLDSAKFSDDTMFAQLFAQTKDTLFTERLLPRDIEGFISAPNARLGRTRELRRLFDPAQLAALYGDEGELAWLTGDITQDRTPDLREYLIKELTVPEHAPDDIVRRFNSEFLEAQPDAWVQRLYEFLNGQPALHRLLPDIPILRLQDGSHVAPKTDGHVSAFLPTEATTGFPTVRVSVCTSEGAREFLLSLGLKEPDPVDDVIANVLPKYQAKSTDGIDDTEYATDISRILTAFRTDSQTQRKKLVYALASSRFVMSVDATKGSKHCVEPTRVYLATRRLRNLLDGAKGILFVDDSHSCLQGEEVRSLLEASGATRHLQPVPVLTSFSDEQKRSMRVEAGCEDCSGRESVYDTTLRGLESLLALLPDLDREAQATRAGLLWEALDELEDRRGKAAFAGTYHWSYVQQRTAAFAAAFVRRLNEARWVPDIDGTLHRPEFVSFHSLGWNGHPFLESVIHFNPPEVGVLAQKLGIEPGMIELLQEAGINTEEALRERLGLTARATEDADSTGPREDTHTEPRSKTGQTGGTGQGARTEAENGTGNAGATTHHEGANSRAFISYVAVHSENEETDPDALTHEKRMALEERAIEFILASEPAWQRTPANNAGYDLFRSDQRGETIYCEVKAMTGTLDDRPVGISRTQFDHSYKHGESFWLYIVEHAGSSGDARIVRIQDPAGNARTFTYDSGWRAIDAPHGFPNDDDKRD